MAKVSVIVPVYNTGKYVERCLNSLIHQTLKDEMEIIVVNDGSTDNSEEVIKKFIENHKKENIKYLKKENGGLADARNFAISHVTGKYISFVDSDDYIAENLYGNLEKYMDQDIDLIKFKMQMVSNKGEKIDKIAGPTFEKCTGEEGFERLCITDKLLDSACLYLYRKEFYKENEFEYKKGTYHEDFGLTSLIMLKAKSFISVKEYGYYYCQTDDSITRNSSYEKEIKKANDLLQHYDDMIKVIEQYQISEKSKDLVKRYYTNNILLKAKELKEKELKEYIQQIQKRKMYKNIKSYNLKQLIKKIILKINIRLYLKLR